MKRPETADSLPTGRGLFIVFEGLDGAGTTTQANALASWLAEFGVPVELTHEPSFGPLGALARAAIQGRLSLSPESLALLFAGDRADHLFNVVNGICASVDAGAIVICDRYVLSSLAYQAVQGLPVDWLLEINARALTPDVTIFVDATVDTCMRRIGKRSGHQELFHSDRALRDVAAAYRRVLARGKFISTLVTADGNQHVDIVAKQIQSGLSDSLDKLEGGELLKEALEHGPQFVPTRRKA